MLDFIKREIIKTGLMGNSDNQTTEWTWMLVNQYALAVQYGNASAFDGLQYTHLLMSEIRSTFETTRGTIFPV